MEETLDGEQRQEDAKSAREDEELRWAEEAARADEEWRQAEESKAAQARRVARGLKYGLLEKCEVNGRKVEIYANEQRTRAIYLIDNGRTCDVRYVDKYMDVNAAIG